MIEVRDKNNNIRCKVEITDKSVYSKTLMEDEYVLLSFESDTLIAFQKKDSIKTDFGTFRIKKVATPVMQSDGGYLYEQKFVPDWVFWEDRILFYNRQSGSEKEWKMTQRPEYFMDIVVRNIQDSGFGRYTFEVDESLTEMKLVEFDSTNIIDALSKIAEAWETEWWITDRVIHISKCEFGSPISLSEHDELGDIDREDGQDTTYITRAYVFGSTRNLPKNYRKNDDGTVVVEGVVETRLKLPAGTPYIDAWENMKDEDVVEGVIVLEEVYPRNIGTISKITTKKYTDKIENEDGTVSYEDWNAFRFTDSSLPTFKKEYILADQELRIVFQTGKLAGMDFAVTFNPDALTETEAGAQVFEIVRNDTYGVDLPTDTFKPEVGDTYILYGYDTKYVYNNLVSKAEQELYTKGIEELAEASKDKSVYSCPTNPLRCAGYKPNSIGKMIHNTTDEIDLEMGQAVTLRSNIIENGYRLSRVRGFEKRLDNKFNCTYTIGESSAYSRGEALQEQVDALTYQSKQFVNVYGNSVYVVKRYDTTAPSDTNVPSFKRAQYEFLQRNVPNRAAKKISFDEGIELGNFTKGEQGGLIDGNANAELLTMIVRKLISSAHYTSGFNGEGYRLWIDKDGLSNLELDKLTVRQIMTVFELIIDRIRAVGGQIVVSAANGKIKAVEDTGEAYKIFFEGDNYFQPHDLMRCQVFQGENIRSYWVEIVGTYSDYVVVAKSEFEAWATEPQEGDEVVLMGNTENAKRQNLISISATEDGEPRIDVLDGVKAKNLNGALRARLGNLDGITDDWFPLNNQPHGNGLYADNVYLRGSFLLTTGEDIKTKFDIVEGKISSSVEAVRQDFMQEKGYLNNPTFGDGLNHWTAENATTFFFLGNKWIWANDNVLTKKGDGASLTTDDGRVVVRIKNKYICQKFADLRAVPEIKTNEDGKKEPTPVYLSFFYKVKKKGVLTIGFENINNDGFIDYEPLSYSQELDATAKYQQLTISGLWNATGDFKLSFTGEMFVYMFVLSTDRIESLTHTYRTLFEQSDKLIKIAAMNFDKDGNVLESSGIVTTSNFAGMFASAIDNDTDIVKKADISAFITKDENGNIESGVHIGADNISLEGIVTANENFKILEDGSIEAKNGKFSGEINIYDKQGDGLTVYDSEDCVRVNIQSDSIGRIAQMANDTYTYASAHSTTQIKTFNNTATTETIGTLNANRIIDIDNISIMTYGQDPSDGSLIDYPSTSTGSLKIEILNGTTVVANKIVEIAKRDDYGSYKATIGIRYTAKESGTYYVRYTISGITSTSSYTSVSLLVNARVQTSDVVQTLIGADGLYSHTGANKLLWLDENELQFRFGFGGMRFSYPNDQSVKARFDTIAGAYGSTPNIKPVWMPFHNITPMFSPQFSFETAIINTGGYGKYAYKIDPFNDCGICYVDFPAMDANLNEQESWILLPSSSQVYEGNNIQLPRGYTVTIINDTNNKVFVTGNVTFYHGCKIIDANRNENYYCSLNGAQSRDTYIYIGSYVAYENGKPSKGNVDRWIAIHDTQ